MVPAALSRSVSVAAATTISTTLWSRGTMTTSVTTLLPTAARIGSSATLSGLQMRGTARVSSCKHTASKKESSCTAELFKNTMFRGRQKGWVFHKGFFPRGFSVRGFPTRGSRDRPRFSPFGSVLKYQFP
ncbi:hypothetical protein HDK64DRAFT_273213 [Phyllosticta capitalensis]